MTKKELIEELNNVPDDAEIYFYDNTNNRYYIFDIGYSDEDEVVLEGQLPENEDVIPQNAATFSVHFRK